MKKIIPTIGKVIIATVAVSVLMMILLAFLMLKLDVGTKVQNMFVVLIYIVSTFVGGIIIGKVMDKKKFLWGMACGAIYFSVVVVLALVIKNVDGIDSVAVATALPACLLGGTVGGMLG